MDQTKVVVIGAGGKLGRRLVLRGLARGHQVTAFVRDAKRFAQSLGREADGSVRVVEGDALNTKSLSSAIYGHDVVVNAAGNVADGAAFSHLFKSVLTVAEQVLPPPRRFWALAGAATMTIPYAGCIAVGLPRVPGLYVPHADNWKTIEASGTDWSLMCPGPMVAAPGGRVRTDMRVSVDIVPYHVPRLAARFPRIGLSLLMKSKLPELIVSYEDVADIIITNLEPNGPFSRRRVGVALPAGERGRKDGWTLGETNSMNPNPDASERQ